MQPGEKNKIRTCRNVLVNVIGHFQSTDQIRKKTKERKSTIIGAAGTVCTAHRQVKFMK